MRTATVADIRRRSTLIVRANILQSLAEHGKGFPMTEPGQDLEQITLEAELVDEDAEREIAKAVSGRQAIARKYVRWVRRRNPDATPAEIIKALERHYVTAISVAGGIVTAGGIAVSFIPGGGAATKGVKAGVKAAAIGLAKTAAATNLVPAADEQLQFEITAMFGLALADIHGISYDQDQAKALVYGLSNSRVSQDQITSFATDLAMASPSSAVDVGQRIADGRDDWSHWASTLAKSLPGDGAKSLVQSIQAGTLEDLRGRLGKRGQTAVEFSVGAVLSSASRFVFGREVIVAAQGAFPSAPEAFPDNLAVEVKETPEKDDEPNRALLALESAAQATAGWVGGAATAVGSGVTTAASTVSRPFRSVDLDGDGIPDEPQALTAAKGVLDGAKHLGAGLTGFIRPKKRGRHEAGAEDDQRDGTPDPT
jgi:hypothetical protein